MDYSMDILARLQAGEKVEDIAAELTKSINAANEKYAAEKRAAEEKAKAEAAAKSRIADKKIAIEELLDAICDILEIWDVAPDLVDQIENTSDEDIEDIVTIVDEAVPFLVKYMEMQTALQQMIDDSHKEAEKNKEPNNDPVREFLNQFVK